MHEIIDNRLRRNEPLINNLFVPQNRRRMFEESIRRSAEGEKQTSTIMVLKNGFGFIKWPPDNLFFHHENLEDVDFNDLSVDDRVHFAISKGDRGEDVAVNVRLAD